MCKFEQTKKNIQPFKQNCLNWQKYFSASHPHHTLSSFIVKPQTHIPTHSKPHMFIVPLQFNKRKIHKQEQISSFLRQWRIYTAAGGSKRENVPLLLCARKEKQTHRKEDSCRIKSFKQNERNSINGANRLSPVDLLSED